MCSKGTYQFSTSISYQRLTLPHAFLALSPALASELQLPVEQPVSASLTQVSAST